MSEPFGTNRRLAVPKGGSPCTVTESANHRELGLGTKVRQRLANETTVNRAKQAAAMLTEHLFYRTRLSPRDRVAAASQSHERCGTTPHIRGHEALETRPAASEVVQGGAGLGFT